MNLMQVNTQSFIDVYLYLHNIWSAPLQIILSVLLLYTYLGVAAFVGLGVMIVLTPINAFLSMQYSKNQTKKLIEKDNRIKTINEMLNGIKVNNFLLNIISIIKTKSGSTDLNFQRRNFLVCDYLKLHN